MPWVRCAFTNVFLKGLQNFCTVLKKQQTPFHSDLISLFYGINVGIRNKPLFRTWPRGQGSKELCGTGEILSGLCRHQVATKRVLTNAYCVIDADYNNLTIHSTQCVINAQSPNAYCAINAQYTMCHQGTMPPIRVAEVGSLSARAKRPHKFLSGAYLLFLRKMCCFCV